MAGAFTFKQFTIEQPNAAMKVCTDSSLFGAWAAQYITNGMQVLDIGAGTGLLTLMAAQNNAVKLYAVEVDEAAMIDLERNVQQSPWADRIEIFNADISKITLPEKVDFVVCNPPFFVDSLPSPYGSVNTARHDSKNLIEMLPSIAEDSVKASGYFAVLLPYLIQKRFLTLMQHTSFSLTKIVHVKQTARHDYFRTMLLYKKELSVKLTEDEIIIKEDAGYSERFIALLKSYYLYL